ncbi:hypothetical protein A6E01_19690 (plasmid) [Vibrio breoganii]|uniref:Transposase n=1 Tax=Vibrio breoganii TaxID=553239 RepID=A0AAN0XZL3_9VIBR|nr:hypothetical protein [Vibrio breoganii]ANO35438.1 hypothetical protein A6E01_19690 [Vibrio breoganii]
MKDKKTVYVTEFSVRASSQDLSKVKVRMQLATKLYNSILGVGLKRLDVMRKDPSYSPLMDGLRVINKSLKLAEKKGEKKKISALKKEKKPISGELNALRKSYLLTKYDLIKSVTPMRVNCYFNQHISSKVAQGLATRAWDAIERHMFSGFGRPRFKSKHRPVRSLEVNAHESIMVKMGSTKKPTRLIWQGIEAPLNLLADRDTDGYQGNVLSDIQSNKIKYNRVILRTVKGKERLYVQSVISGLAPQKQKHLDGQAKAKGRRVAFDIGVNSIAIYSETEAKLLGFVADIKKLDGKLAKLQRKSARIQRLLNADNYQRVAKVRGRKTVHIWQRKKGTRDTVKSNHWHKINSQIVELHRLLAAKRKQYHDIIANDILALGDEIVTEKVSVKGWQKMFGKSINAFAPSGLITTIKRKAENADAKFEFINTVKARLSQYNHETDQYIKKSLSARWTKVDGEWYQRDLYSAYLAWCICDSRLTVERTKAITHWSSARQHLDAAAQHVTQHANRTEFFGSSAGLQRPPVEPVAA